MQDRRRETRKNTDIAVNCRVDAHVYPTRVFNFSNNGCQVELPTGSVMPGSRVLIELNRRLVFPATVRWAVGDRAGMEFASPQHGAMLEQLHASRSSRTGAHANTH